MKENREEETDICELVRRCTAALYVEFEKRHIEVIPDIPEMAIMSRIDRCSFPHLLDRGFTNPHVIFVAL